MRGIVMEIDGVKDAVADVRNQTVVIAFDDSRTTVDDIQAALISGGYPPHGAPKWLAAFPAYSSEDRYGEKMLVGEITAQELDKEFPIFWVNAEQYSPDEQAVTGIKALTEKIDLVLFLGTWCPDSQQEAPKLIKIYERAANPNLSLTIYGVDRRKKDPDGMAEKYSVARVPTTVVLRDGRELGRIVAYPRKSVERDLLDIVEGGM